MKIDLRFKLRIVNSRPDKYGNCYWGLVLIDNRVISIAYNDCVVSEGKVAAPNIDTLDCEKMGWYCKYNEDIPIREFNRRFKNTQYLGCNWDKIKTKLRADLARYLLERG